MLVPSVAPYWLQRIAAASNHGTSGLVVQRLVAPERSWRLSNGLVTTVRPMICGGGPSGICRALWYWWRRDPDIAFGFAGDPLGGALAVLGRLTRRPTAVYVEQLWPEQAQMSRIRSVIKQVVYRSAPLLLSPGLRTDAYAQAFSRRPVMRLRHVVDAKALGVTTTETDHRLSPERRVLFVGRLEAEKGVFDLLEAFEVLQESIPGAKLRMVGDGRSHEEVERLAVENPSVEICGFAEYEALGNHYRWADVLCLPSWFDTYGLVIDEAMAFGVPFVATDRVGEVAERSATGAGDVVVAKSPSALAKALGAMFDEDRWTQGSAAAYAWTLDHGLDDWVEDLHRAAKALHRLQVSR